MKRVDDLYVQVPDIDKTLDLPRHQSIRSTLTLHSLLLQYDNKCGGQIKTCGGWHFKNMGINHCMDT